MVARQRWIWGAGAFLLVLGAFAGVVACLPSVYESSTTLLIEPQQIPDGLVKSTVTGPLQMRFASVKARVLSRPSLGRMIRCFGLYGFEKNANACAERGLEDGALGSQVIPQAVTDQMRQDVQVEPRGGQLDAPTVAIAIHYRGPQPQTVADVANALSSSYVLEYQRMRGEQTAGAVTFLRHEVEERSQKLRQLDRTIWEFTRRHAGEPREKIELQLRPLSREYDVTYEEYKSLAARQMEAALAESMENLQKGEQLRVIERALPATDPIAPARPRLYAVALALALVAAVVVILGLGRLRADPSPESIQVALT